LVVFLIVAGAAATLDLVTKHWVFNRYLDKSECAAVIREFYLADPPPPEQQTSQYAREVLRRLRIQHRVCFGLSLTLSTNPGVVFGFDYLPLWTVNLINFAMIVLVVAFFLASESCSTWLHAALAFILGGAAGNLYDRLFSQVSLPGLAPIRHHVRDFIDCSDLGYRYIFNLADVWLVVGVGMILAQWAWSWRKDRKATKS
jgi:lipoprotein signal peptidase